MDTESTTPLEGVRPATARLSVVVTCYDLGAYLQEALESVARHFTRDEVEVVVVDDGSTDPATRAVIAGLDRARYVVVEQDNQGLARARNNGIRRASGAYIIPLDADNRLHPVFVERAMAVLDARPEVGIVYGDAMYVGERSGRWVVGPYDFKRLLRSNYIDACACFRRSVWERAGGYDEHMPYMGWEDWDLWLRCSALGIQFHYEAEVFFDYRVRPGSMIQDTRLREAELMRYIFDKPALRFLRPLREQLLAPPPAGPGQQSGRTLLRLLVQRITARLTGSDRAQGPAGR
jgi:glycosyltransferase involved in cell wall biosynthesis